MDDGYKLLIGELTIQLFNLQSQVNELQKQLTAATQPKEKDGDTIRNN